MQAPSFLCLERIDNTIQAGTFPAAKRQKYQMCGGKFRQMNKGYAEHKKGPLSGWQRLKIGWDIGKLPKASIRACPREIHRRVRGSEIGHFR
jgi:hypothetical protein